MGGQSHYATTVAKILKERSKTITTKHGTQINTIALESLGGDVLEAMKIGRLIRKLYLKTNANYDCASACLLIYAAGVERTESFIGRSSIRSEGKDPSLGFHRPRFTDVEGFSQLSPEAASIRYNEVLGMIESYLTEMDTSQRFIELMFGSSSDDIEWITAYEAKIKGILPPVPKAIDEWKRANCNLLTEKESYDFNLIPGRESGALLNDHEKSIVNAFSQGYMDYLGKKWLESVKCEQRIERKARKEALAKYFAT